MVTGVNPWFRVARGRKSQGRCVFKYARACTHYIYKHYTTIYISSLHIIIRYTCFSLITKEVATMDGSAAEIEPCIHNYTGLLRVRNKVLRVSSSACQSCVRHGRKARKRKKTEKKQRSNPITNN
jgi:ribosomal protein L24E